LTEAEKREVTANVQFKIVFDTLRQMLTPPTPPALPQKPKGPIVFQPQ
jgi:hypothetical protein